MSLLVIVRHGQSLWNLENRFTGWVDVPLTTLGEEEARKAGIALANTKFDVAYTSVLTRATHTLDLMKESGNFQIPTIRDAALNERHYGDLQGMNKDEMRQQYGEEQVHIWRRSYDIAPPNGESLKDTAARTIPFLERAILGDIRQGKNVLVVAHGNSNRAIVMAIENLDSAGVMKVELATGIPRAYQLDATGKLIEMVNL